MLLDAGLLLLGGLMLYFGAEWLVRGAAGLARALGVAPLVIGLTVVSYGTSAPELAVNIIASTSGSSELALGNVVGSNIANIGLILGLTALIAPPSVDGSLIRRELPLLVLATMALPLVLLDSVVGRIDAAIFAAGALLFTYAAFKWAGRDPNTADEMPEEVPETRSRLLLSGLLIVGLVALVGGGKLFVTGAVQIALVLGMSERLVGLTIVAIGTSLPELAASLVAALRGHSELAVGNVVGSNIFNILLILGVTGLIHPIAGSIDAMKFDLSVLVAVTLVCVLFMRRRRVITRPEGVVLLACYFGFIAAAVMLR